DQMCANRDERIWKIAQGETVPEKCDDSNVPPFLEVKTSFGVNRKTEAGANTGQTSKTAEGSSAEISPSGETLKKFKLAPGYAINLFASSEQFPELANAVSLTFDAQGRMWCTTMPSYPQWRPGDPMDDKIVILDDSDHDGKADYCSVFAGGLQCPLGIEFSNGGVFIGHQRDMLFMKSSSGGDKADIIERVLTGFDSADSHHANDTYTLGPGGDLYFQEGTFHHTQVETPYGPVRCKNAGTFRFEPRTGKLDLFVSYSYANPHGIAFDEWGQTFIADASGGANYFATAFSGWLPYPEKHATMQQFFPKRVRPTSGCEFVSSRHFPDEAQGRFLLNNCIGVQGVLQHEVKAVGSGYEGKEIEPLVLCDDTNFRPVALRFGPDGALYIVDWQDALVGHMQYSLRDPLRDHKQARIWRVTYPSRPLIKPPQIAGEKIEKLLELLKEPEYRTRERVKQELSMRDSKEVMHALNEWLGGKPEEIVTKISAIQEHQLLEALWVCQWHNVVNMRLLHRALQSGIPQSRAGAVRVLCYWRDRVPEIFDLLGKAVHDKHPLVRLEAVRACSFYGDPLRSRPGDATRAANIALGALNHEMDYYLTYTLAETMRALKPSPKDINVAENPKALAYVLDRMTNDELKAAPKVEAVFRAQLERKGLDAVTRDAAAIELAKLKGTTREQELITAIMSLDAREVDSPASSDLGKLLAASPRAALKKAQGDIMRMASKDHSVHSARVAGMAAYMALTGDPERTWTERQDNQETLMTLLESCVLIPDPALRAKFQPLLIDALQTKPQPDKVRRAALAALPLTGAEHAAVNFGLAADF
ncbi:MAG TPA: PVC-type heme-binding CxxCH protein, partial [Verrucomicrobiaceae bacterium]